MCSVDKKTRTLSVKVGPELHQKAMVALEHTSAETVSRFFRWCLEDLIRADQAGEQIVEPIALLTVQQRRKLETDYRPSSGA